MIPPRSDTFHLLRSCFFSSPSLLFFLEFPPDTIVLFSHTKLTHTYIHTHRTFVQFFTPLNEANLVSLTALVSVHPERTVEMLPDAARHQASLALRRMMESSKPAVPSPPASRSKSARRQSLDDSVSSLSLIPFSAHRHVVFSVVAVFTALLLLLHSCRNMLTQQQN
jgi:hypothetical protein